MISKQHSGLSQSPGYLIGRGLCRPLPAMSYTNEVLVIFLGLGILSGMAYAVFNEKIHAMSWTIEKIQTMNRVMMEEKLDLTVARQDGTALVVTIANYGTSESSILEVVSETGAVYRGVCSSNNNNATDFAVQPESQIQITCPIGNATQKHFVITQGRQIIDVPT